MLDLLGRSTALSHEDVFIGRYQALVLVALKVTDGNRQEAEDLVHEAFIRFTLVQPPLDEVQHLDAYLSRMLRNMYTSRIRRRQRAAETSLSILDYDSLDIGFHAIDVRAKLEVREALRAACEYGCIRKRSSKTGSVFLLRFFHGYLPSEIASLARLSSAIVDALVFRARREVKVYVEHPNQLAFIGGRDAKPPSVSHVGHHFSGANGAVGAANAETDPSEHAFVHELRARIFNDTHNRCWSKKALRDLYRDPSAEALSRDVLADLVGCPICLDAANALLGLPRLADRWPADTLGPGSRGGPSGGGAAASISSGRRRTRAVFEHRPRELRVSVNGFVIGAHTIGLPESDLTLSVNLSEPIALIELLSEQGLCLVFLDIAPPPAGNARQRRRVDLSDGRYAELEVTFAGPWPTVRASYGDPHRLSTAHSELAGEVDETNQTQVVMTLPRRAARLFGLRPASATVLVGAVLAWLLFWTPGTPVSAAERIANTIRWLVTAVFGSESSPTTREAVPRSSSTRDIALPPFGAASRPTTPAALTSARRTYLELKALAELHQVGAYLGQELSLAARDGVGVQVRAVVDTKARRQALLTALQPLLVDPNVRARVTTLDEVAAQSKRRAPAATDARAFQFVGDEFPMFATVRRYLLHQHRFQREESGAADPAILADAELDNQTRRFATQVLDRSRRASQHAWALKHLGDRFPAALISQASDDTREIWRGLVREHARAYQQEMALLERDLAPVALTIDAEAAQPGESDASRVISTGDAWSRFTQLLETHRRQDAAIQQGFAIQSDAGDDVDAVHSAAFWKLIERCEALATAIARDPLGGA
jgi:RNA polymerase sigma factor (sigma-70 family)